MDRIEALAILDLPPNASEAEIQRQSEHRRADLEKRVASAPTFPLKVKYRAELERIENAITALHTSTGGGEDLDDLPISQKLDGESGHGYEPSSSGVPGETFGPAASPPGRQPPKRPGSGEPPEAAPGGRRPPQRPPEAVAKGDGGGTKPPKAPSGTRPAPARPVPEADPYGEEAEAQEPVVRGTRPVWVTWTVVAAVAAFFAGIGYAGWSLWWLPKVAAENTAKAADLLSEVTSRMAAIEDPAEKARTLAWVSAALGSVGEAASADGLIAQGRNTITTNFQQPGSIRSALECRLLVAQAMKGDPQGALAELAKMQTEREQAAKTSSSLNLPGRSGTSGQSKAVPLVPVYEDQARCGVVVAQARQGRSNEAKAMVNSITDDRWACEALAAVAEAFARAGEKDETITVLQTLEGRAAKIPEPHVKAALLCTVAERTSLFVGRQRADIMKKFVSEAISAASSSGSSGSGGAAMAGKSALAQARVLRTLWRTKDKANFAKRIIEVNSLAGLINGTSGINNGKPDFGARAEVYASVALAWADAGEEEKAMKAIDDAISAAEQARLPVEQAEAERLGLKLDFHKERALATVVRALAEMGSFDKAEELFGRLRIPDVKATAGEALSYWLGYADEIERGKQIARQLADGEAQCQAVVALQYGVRKAHLEPWW